MCEITYACGLSIRWSAVSGGLTITVLTYESTDITTTFIISKLAFDALVLEKCVLPVTPDYKFVSLIHHPYLVTSF